MTDEQMDEIARGCFYGYDTVFHDVKGAVREAVEARDKQWEQMLASQPQWVEGKVYPIDNATPPEPETGFSLLTELM